MARVVQRRTPPYLLIVFVILFVFATVMAVLFFNKYDKAEKQRKRLAAIQAELISREQFSRPEIRQMINNYNKATGGVRPTVVGQLTDQVSTLASAITGLPNTTFLEASQEIEKAFAAINPPVRRGLLKHLTDFHDELGVKDARITKLQGEKAQLAAQLAKAVKDLAAAKADFEDKLKQKADELASLDQKFQNFQRQQDQKLADAQKAFTQARDELNKQIADQTEKIQTLQRMIARLQKELAIYKKPKEGPSLRPERIVRRPDGKVSQVLANEGLVYLNIGAKENVTEGLRFTVYPYTGITETGAGKGVVEVVNVSENVSEARIIRQDKNDPIVPGDLVANVVFDMLRTYRFVVEGEFDPDNTGTPSDAGNKVIRELVRRYGGPVVNDVTVDTDYVVLGDPPLRPRKPDDTDPQEAWDAYQQQLKAFNRYQQVKQLAEKYQIPQLGGRRFLDLVGYIPAKPAKRSE
ncbi:MAG: hypothetical protein J7M21_03425 [Planctomycetes bacterium]|nr:hypothetical protein [Planctomycetota bacterium]